MYTSLSRFLSCHTEEILRLTAGLSVFLMKPSKPKGEIGTDADFRHPCARKHMDAVPNG
ncbi:MAG: hypothetical protein J6B10_06625 [Lachnospiraceae bacterium]|nr:hypothetical protein [Lachnospiraceae bacterium]